MKKKLNKLNLGSWINKLILKKGKALKINFIVDKFLFLLVKNIKKDPFCVINEAIHNIQPLFLIKEVKMGKKRDKNFYIPHFIVSTYIRKKIALNWLVTFALKRKGVFVDNLVLEVLDAFNNKGLAKQKLDNLNSQVLEHRSNLKFRWK
jgi:ribosomal protein S7